MPIVIEGGSRSAGRWWARHLQDAEKNERVELVEIVGLSAATVPALFREMRAIALGTRCKNYFYQYNINPRGDEHLTGEQWKAAHGITLANLGLGGQPHFRVRHTKNGRTHEHGIALRIDLERMKAIPDSLTARIHEQTSRQLEIKFGLERGQSILVADRQQPRPARRPKKWETFRGGESGLDPRNISNELAALWQGSDSGPGFRAALETTGYILAKGDRRNLVVIDRAGDEHSLTRRLGIKAADVNARMSAVDPASLPSVAEAKADARQAQQAAAMQQLSQDFSRASLAITESAPEAVETREPVAATSAPEEATHAPTAPPRVPQPQKTGRVSALFRLARALTFWRRMQARMPQRRRFAIPCRSPPVTSVE
jgi:hypothetical protein